MTSSYPNLQLYLLCIVFLVASQTKYRPIKSHITKFRVSQILISALALLRPSRNISAAGMRPAE